MEQQMHQVLQMLQQPAFFVQEQKILWCNKAAESLVCAGQEIEGILGESSRLYSLWDRTCPMHTAVRIFGRRYTAKVQVVGERELFVLEKEVDDDSLSAAAMRKTSVYLRRVLQTMMDAGDSLLSCLADQEQESEDGQQLNHSIYRLNRLCTQLSDSAKLLEGTMELHCASYNLSAFMEDFLQEVEPLVEESGWRLSYHCGDTVPYVTMDASLVKRALYNLLANALQYTPKGKEIKLSLRQLGGLVSFSISDGGETMPDHLLMGEGMEETMDSRRGSGMGLVLVRRIAELHGGSLFCTANEGGKGMKAIFSIKLRGDGLSLSTPKLQIDPYGGLHCGLVELSDALDPQMYHPDRV